jgi:hypothetical protein
MMTGRNTLLARTAAGTIGAQCARAVAWQFGSVIRDGKRGIWFGLARQGMVWFGGARIKAR